MPLCFSLLFILLLSGERASLRGDEDQMDFAALDYSNDGGKVRQRGVTGAAGYTFTHITIRRNPKENPARHTHTHRTSRIQNQGEKTNRS